MSVASGARPGFSLLEAAVALCILSVAATLAVPGILRWQAGARLRAAADTLRGDLQSARAAAARLGCWVVVSFGPDGWVIFADSGRGGGARNNGVQDGDERVLVQRRLPAGVRVAACTFGGGRAHFNSRGGARAGSLRFIGARGRGKRVVVSSVGRIRIEDG